MRSLLQWVCAHNCSQFRDPAAAPAGNYRRGKIKPNAAARGTKKTMTLTEPIEPVPAAELAAQDAKQRRTIFGLVGVFLTALIVIMAVQWATNSTDDTAEGLVLPDLRFTTIDGEEFALTELIGQPTVINFFASWCAPCLAEMPEFEQAHQAHLSDVRFVGVNARETNVDDARAVVATTGVTYKILLGDDGEDGGLHRYVTDLGALPTTAFVDANGVIVDVFVGVLRGEDLETRIQELLG